MGARCKFGKQETDGSIRYAAGPRMWTNLRDVITKRQLLSNVFVWLGQTLLANLIKADVRRLHRSPRRGKETIAQGKGAQRLPPWVTARPTTTPLFTVRRASRRAGAADREKRGIFIIGS